MAVNLEELRVRIYASSPNLGIPPLPRNVVENGARGRVHRHLKTLYLHHDAGIDCTPVSPSHRLFEGVTLEALEDLYYSCTGYPHDNSIQWLKEEQAYSQGSGH